MNIDFNAVNAAVTAATESAFEELITDDSVPTVAYADSWSNGTGYFDGLACEEREGYRIIFKSVDDYGRRVLFIQSNGHRAVIFERTAGDHRLFCHVPRHNKTNWVNNNGNISIASRRAGLEAYCSLSEVAEVGLKYYTEWATAQAT